MVCLKGDGEFYTKKTDVKLVNVKYVIVCNSQTIQVVMMQGSDVVENFGKLGTYAGMWVMVATNFEIV